MSLKDNQHHSNRMNNKLNHIGFGVQQGDVVGREGMVT
jgi:hypothetical protein